MATFTRIGLILALLMVLAACRHSEPQSSAQLVVWAWERPEDLRFLPKDVSVAVQAGFIDLAGDGFVARGRRFPLRVSAPPRIALVHVQIDPRRPLDWTPALRRRVAAAALHYAQVIPVRQVQIDFEVPRSQRRVLLDLLTDMRAGLPKGITLSMTALASWCQEGWLSQAPVDEIVPMLFRMDRGDPTIRARIEARKDLADPRCRQALAISVDTPIARLPPRRKVYLFDPHSWTRADFDMARGQVEQR